MEELPSNGDSQGHFESTMEDEEIETKPIRIECMRKKWDQVLHFALKENELQQRQNEIFKEMKSRKSASQWNISNSIVDANCSFEDIPLEQRPTCDRIEVVPQHDLDEKIRVRSRTLEWNERINAMSTSSKESSLDRSPSNGVSGANLNETEKKLQVLKDIKADRIKEQERIKYQKLAERRQNRSQKGSLSALIMHYSGNEPLNQASPANASTPLNGFKDGVKKPPSFSIVNEIGLTNAPKHSNGHQDASPEVSENQNGYKMMQFKDESPTNASAHDSEIKEVIEIKKELVESTTPTPVPVKTKKKAPPPPVDGTNGPNDQNQDKMKTLEVKM